MKRRLRQRLRGEVTVDRLVAQGLELGHGTYIGRGVYIDAGHPWLISIGDNSVLTAGTIVLAHDGSTRLHPGCTRIAPVAIGKRVFVGAGAVILPVPRSGTTRSSARWRSSAARSRRARWWWATPRRS